MAPHPLRPVLAEAMPSHLENLATVLRDAPYAGVPLLLLVAIGAGLYQRMRGERSTRRALELAAADRITLSSTQVERWVDALRATDPAFELLPFFDAVRHRFVTLMNAWTAGALAAVKPFVSDGLAAQLAAQGQLMATRGVRMVAADPRVVDLQLVGLEQTPHFDAIHVRVTALVRWAEGAATARDEDLRAQALRSPPQRVLEHWYLLRRPGAQQRGTPVDAPDACPSCGAVSAMPLEQPCPACGALANSGAHRWIVAERTSGPSLWRAREVPEGLARLRQTDPALSSECLEDRAALIFWTWLTAQALETPQHLAPLATPAFLDTLRAESEGLRATRRRRVLTDCSVRATHLRRVAVQEGVEVAHVEVRWRARLGFAPVEGPLRRAPLQPRRSVLILQRRAGATSAGSRGLATGRCCGCSAPLAGATQPSCPRCGEALAAGQGDWVLRELLSWEPWIAAAPQDHRPSTAAGRLPDLEERERLLCATAAAAGPAQGGERRLWRMLAHRWGVPWINVEFAMTLGFDGAGQRICPGPAEAEVYLRTFLELALVDGTVDPRERRALEMIARRLGIGHRLPALLSA